MTVPHPNVEDAIGKSMALAEVLHQSGWTAKAEDTYRAVLRDRPEHAEALYRLGLLRDERDDRTEAIALVRAALSIDPQVARYHLSLARMLVSDGDLVAVAERYKRALALDPANVDVLVRLGSLRNWEDRIAEAAALYQRALAVEPDEPVVLRHVAGIHLTKGDPRMAERHLRTALAADDGIAETHVALGEALRAQDRWPEAAEAYERAIGLDGDRLNASLGLAEALEALGRRDEAAQRLCEAAAALDQDADALQRIGARLFDQGYEPEAAAVYSRFASLTTDRDRFPGFPTRCVAVRPAADACREHGWPYRAVVPATPIRVTGSGGTAYEYRLPEVFLAFAEDAVIVPNLHAPLVGGDTLLIDGFSTNSRISLTMLPHLVWHSRDDRMLIDLPEPARTIEEEAILLGGGINWSHGVLDWMSKLAVLEHFPDLDRLPVLVAGNMLRSILDLAELLGLDRGRMVPLTPGEVVRARRLWLPSLTHTYQFTSPMHVDFLRRRLAAPIAEGLSRPRRRLFLTRRQAGYRALVNEAAVLAALAPLGVEAVVAEELPMAEQIALFASAELIIGPIGGGSAAIAFAAPGAAYVELVHRRIALPQYGILTALLGQRYRQIVGPMRGNRGPSEFDYDFEVPSEAVVAAARALLAGD